MFYRAGPFSTWMFPYDTTAYGTVHRRHQPLTRPSPPAAGAAAFSPFVMAQKGDPDGVCAGVGGVGPPNPLSDAGGGRRRAGAPVRCSSGD